MKVTRTAQEEKIMNTNTMKLDMNEMEQVSGGGIDSYLTWLKQGYDHVLCHELDCHDFEWNGEYTTLWMDGKHYQKKLLRCSRCGATKGSIGYSLIDD